MWDLALDPDTGDFIFGPQRDLLGASGEGVVLQRIYTRLKIPVGSFVYDIDGTLGSALHQIHGYPSARQLREAPTLVQAALGPMEDVQVNDVTVSEDENHRMLVQIAYSSTPPTDDESEEFDEPETPEFTTNLTID